MLKKVKANTALGGAVGIRWKLYADFEAGVSIFKHESGAMKTCDGLDKAQAESTPWVAAAFIQSIETAKHPFAFLGRDTGAVIAYHQRWGFAMHLDAKRYPRAWGTVTQGVFDQVGSELNQ